MHDIITSIYISSKFDKNKNVMGIFTLNENNVLTDSNIKYVINNTFLYSELGTIKKIELFKIIILLFFIPYVPQK